MTGLERLSRLLSEIPSFGVYREGQLWRARSRHYSAEGGDVVDATLGVVHRYVRRGAEAASTDATADRIALTAQLYASVERMNAAVLAENLAAYRREITLQVVLRRQLEEIPWEHLA